MVTIVVTVFTAADHLLKIRVPHPPFSQKKHVPRDQQRYFLFRFRIVNCADGAVEKKDVTIPTPFLSYPNQTFPELNIPTELNHQAEYSGHSAWYQRRHSRT